MKLAIALFIGAAAAAAPPRIELDMSASHPGTYSKNDAVGDHFHPLSNVDGAIAGVQSRREFTLTCDIEDHRTSATGRCTLPTARAFDRYKNSDLSSNIVRRVFLTNDNGITITNASPNAIETSTTDAMKLPADRTAIDWFKRSTYLIYYDVTDDNGNHAEQVVLQLVLDDHEKPTFDTANDGKPHSDLKCSKDEQGRVTTTGDKDNQGAVEAADPESKPYSNSPEEFRMCLLSATDNSKADQAADLNARITYTITDPEGEFVVQNVDYAAASNKLTTKSLCGSHPTVGTYTIDASVHDTAMTYGENNRNNVQTVQFTVKFVDRTIPVIQMHGPQHVKYECDNKLASKAWAENEVDYPYTFDYENDFEKSQIADPAMTATDERDDTCGITCGKEDEACRRKAFNADDVNEEITGTYTVTYSHHDVQKNAAIEVKRTVEVVDTTPPTVLLMGPEKVTVWTGKNNQKWIDPWAKCSDYCTVMPDWVPGSGLHQDTAANRGSAKWLQCPGTCSGGVEGIDNKTPGLYIREYCCQDEAGLKHCLTRNIEIVDKDEPMITMTQVNLDNVPDGTSTHIDLTLEATKKGDKHMAAAGHPTQYQDAGATCSDFHDTDANKKNNVYKHARSWNHAGNQDNGSQLSVVTEFRFRKLDETEFSGSWQTADNVHVEDYIDLTKIGVNEVRYSCTDLAGNAAQQMTRTITVVDTRCPFVTINGPPLTYVEAGFDYVDQGATATDSLDANALQVATSGAVDTYAHVHGGSCAELAAGNQGGAYHTIKVKGVDLKVWCDFSVKPALTWYKIKNAAKRINPYSADQSTWTECRKRGLTMPQWSDTRMRTALQGLGESTGETDAYYCTVRFDGMTIARHGIKSSEKEHADDSKLNSVHAEAGLYVLSYAAQDAADNCNDAAQCQSAACAKPDAKFAKACAAHGQKDANERAGLKEELRGLGCGNVVAETKRTVVVKDTLPPVIYLKLPNNYLNDKQVDHIRQYGVRGIGNGSGLQQPQAQINEAAEPGQREAFKQMPYAVQPNDFPRRLMAEVADSQTNTAGIVLGVAAAMAMLAVNKRKQSRTFVPV